MVSIAPLILVRGILPFSRTRSASGGTSIDRQAVNLSARYTDPIPPSLALFILALVKIAKKPTQVWKFGCPLLPLRWRRPVGKFADIISRHRAGGEKQKLASKAQPIEVMNHCCGIQIFFRVKLRQAGISLCNHTPPPPRIDDQPSDI